MTGCGDLIRIPVRQSALSHDSKQDSGSGPAIVLRLFRQKFPGLFVKNFRFTGVFFKSSRTECTFPGGKSGSENSSAMTAERIPETSLRKVGEREIR